MFRKISSILAAGALASAAFGLTAHAQDHMAPRQAIEAAADAAPAGVDGVFEVRVRTVGRSEDRVILNSEADYRDQRNLSIVLSPEAVQAIEAKYGQRIEDYFQGHKLLVSGQARRVTIWFFADGERSDKYYYQTHVDVADPEQLKLVE
jgi:hypothetical protein